MLWNQTIFNVSQETILGKIIDGKKYLSTSLRYATEPVHSNIQCVSSDYWPLEPLWTANCSTLQILTGENNGQANVLTYIMAFYDEEMDCFANLHARQLLRGMQCRCA